MKMKPKKMPKAMPAAMKKGSAMPFMPKDKKGDMKYKDGGKVKRGSC